MNLTANPFVIFNYDQHKCDLSDGDDQIVDSVEVNYVLLSC